MKAGTAAAGSVLAEVAGHVEALTRFDASDLQAVGEEQVQLLDVQLDQRQVLKFEIVQRDGTGVLPAGVQRLGSAAEATQALEAERAALQAAAPAALQAWVDRDDGRYRRLLPAEAGLARPSRRFGHDRACTHCRGQGQTTCERCGGKRRTGCGTCGASGRERCGACGGSRSQSCGGCGGRGQWTEYVTEQRWDPQQNANVTWGRNEWRQCSGCGGSGRRTCMGCAGSGHIVCRGCGGGGQVDCHTCHASGRVSCVPCAASGSVHRLGEVQPRASLQEGLSAAEADAAVAKLLPRLAIESLPTLGTLRHQAQVVRDGAVLSRYAVQVAVRRLALRCRGRDYLIHGFGAQPLVPDHGHLAAHLLQDDLLALEAALAAAGGRGGAALATAASRFAQSELNLAIVEQVAAGQPVQATLAGHEGLVDADYLQRASRALGAAMQRLQGSLLRTPMWLAPPVLALLSAAAYVLWGPGLPGAQAAAVLVAVALAGWFGLEGWARGRLRRLFPAGAGARLLQLAQQRGDRRRRRVLALGALGVAGALGPLAMALTPPVQRLHHARWQAGLQDTQILAWQRQPYNPDLRLRQGPDAALLQQRQQHGGAAVRRAATVITAWRLLPNARGDAPDLARASELLAAAELDGDALAQIGRAALVALRPASTRAQLDQAAEQLRTHAQAAPLEAAYWQAHLLLHPASVQAARPRGLNQLLQVANSGHGHAALEVARRYERGDGFARNPGRVPRYRQLAQAAGLKAEPAR
ncbi:hypothetical protein [Pseudorhodoferax sp.]|uniref:hypothetical protein n=1 Tax=Pseudorhodoferax sp. TaxID=1993553 RepID=UPI002DD653B6|nr:hypothetical protein [Pseudorhodoferax sp.]